MAAGGTISGDEFTSVILPLIRNSRLTHAHKTVFPGGFMPEDLHGKNRHIDVINTLDYPERMMLDYDKYTSRDAHPELTLYISCTSGSEPLLESYLFDIPERLPTYETWLRQKFTSNETVDIWHMCISKYESVRSAVSPPGFKIEMESDADSFYKLRAEGGTTFVLDRDEMSTHVSYGDDSLLSPRIPGGSYRLRDSVVRATSVKYFRGGYNRIDFTLDRETNIQTMTFTRPIWRWKGNVRDGLALARRE